MKIIEFTNAKPAPVEIESGESNLYQHIAFVAVEELRGGVYLRRRDNIAVDVFGKITIQVGKPFDGRVLIIHRLGG